MRDKPQIKKIYVFYFKSFKPEYKVSCDIEYIEYSDIIRYVFFYRLLEEISKESLIIVDGCMRTQNRKDLTYNCLHHYLNQTDNRIIFEYFPFIENKDDFMILLDMENSAFKSKEFDWAYLQEEDIKINPLHIKMTTIFVEITKEQEEKYNDTKEKLFENLGNKKPETVPRNLQLLAGDFKKAKLDNDKIYIARNKRFNLENVLSYKEAARNKDYIIIDTHYRRINMQDFLRVSGIINIKYLATPLSIDNYIVNDFAKWRGRLEAFYAQANLY